MQALNQANKVDISLDDEYPLSKNSKQKADELRKHITKALQIIKDMAQVHQQKLLEIREFNRREQNTDSGNAGELTDICLISESTMPLLEKITAKTRSIKVYLCVVKIIDVIMT